MNGKLVYSVNLEPTYCLFNKYTHYGRMKRCLSHICANLANCPSHFS